MNSKTLSSPNLTAMDFPALAIPDGQNTPKYGGDDIQQSGNPYRTLDKDNMFLFKSSASGQSRGATDFASAVRKLAQDSSMWKYDRNGSAESTVGSSRSSHVLASAYNSGHGRSAFSERLQSRGSARAAPTWLETGEAVGNIPQTTKLLAFMLLLIVREMPSAYIFALTLLRWQQKCILRCGKKHVIMLACGMLILNRYT